MGFCRTSQFALFRKIAGRSLEMKPVKKVGQLLTNASFA